MNKVTFGCFSFLLAFSLWADAQRQISLPQIRSPHCLRTSGNSLLVLQEGTVFVYDAVKGTLLRQFGRLGDGPGESRMFGKRGGILAVAGERVMIDSLQKAIFYTLEGRLIQEIRKPSSFFLNLPLSQGFASLRRHQGLDGAAMALELCKSAEDFTDIRVLATQEPGATRQYIDLFPDALNFAVSSRGLVCEQDGELLVVDAKSGVTRRIKLPQATLPVTDSMKNAALEELATDWEIRQMGGLAGLKRQSELRSAERVQALRELSVDGERAFVWTNSETKALGMAHFWVMDLVSGRLEKEVWLPMSEAVALDDAITGRIDRFYCFFGDSYHTLSFDDDQDMWQLLSVRWR